MSAYVLLNLLNELGKKDDSRLYRVMALDRRQNFVYARYLVNYFVNFEIFICIGLDKMYTLIIEKYFSFIFNRVMALD